MKTTDQLHAELIHTTEELGHLLEKAIGLPGSAKANLERLEEMCARSGRTLVDRRLRVAAIGAIKSGKSTLVNALLGGDHLRRGAGVVTSIVTRVSRGETLKACLYFKSWETINSEIRKALVLFPDGNGGELDTAEFDLRRQKHREALSRGLAGLSSDQLIRTDMRDPNSVLLAAYLKGYPLAAPLIEDQARQQAYTGEQFRDHQGFVGDDALSVYLQDIQLEIPAPGWDEQVEIADCQGSDSPNPHHLAMIQDYLISAHLMLYVVSSRTGLRQADMKFITMLQKMGSMGNILFVVNCDLSEHDNLDDLERVVKRTREDLQPLTANPEIFAFSALYQLFNLPDTELNAKARGRLAAWRADPEMTTFVEAQREAFAKRLQYKLRVERFSVQAEAHLSRLDTILGGFGQWLEISGRLLDQDTAAIRRLKARIDEHQKRMRRSQPVLKTALAGAVEEIKGELRAAADRFFDPHSGEAVRTLMAVVTDPPLETADYADDLQEGGFGDALYRLLQSYRQSVDQVMAESLNPAIIRFIREAESRLVQMLEEVSTPHAEMVHQAVNDYHNAVVGEDAPKTPLVPAAAVQVDLDSLRRELGLQLPTAQAALDYSLQLRGEAFVRLGWDRFVHGLKRLLRRKIDPAAGKGLPALKGALGRMRREMESTIRSHLLNHRENIKFQYLLKLADAARDGLYRQLSEQYSMQIADLAELDDQTRAADPKRADLAQQLADLALQVRSLGRCLNDHRVDLEALSRSYQSQI
jgi:GTPase SAR1 family protein